MGGKRGLAGWGQSLWSHHVEKHLITLEELLCWHKSVKCLATPHPMPLPLSLLVHKQLTNWGKLVTLVGGLWKPSPSKVAPRMPPLGSSAPGFPGWRVFVFKLDLPEIVRDCQRSKGFLRWVRSGMHEEHGTYSWANTITYCQECVGVCVCHLRNLQIGFRFFAHHAPKSRRQLWVLKFLLYRSPRGWVPHKWQKALQQRSFTFFFSTLESRILSLSLGSGVPLLEFKSSLLSDFWVN